MKATIRIAIFLIIISFIFGCYRNGENIDVRKVIIVTIEGCEYIVNQNSYGEILTHKGNCKNPIHIYNKIEKETK